MGPPDEEPVGVQVARTAKALNRAFDQALVAAGGSLPVWLVLVSLKARSHSMQRELADAVGIEGPTLTHHLNRMESAGLITRRRDPDNRRVHRVELTEEGEATFSRLLLSVTAFDRTLRAGLGNKEIQAVTRTLARLRDNVAPLPDREATEA
jgi:MarR family transcriptional regulator, transcriptional regulator for hemolysin